MSVSDEALSHIAETLNEKYGDALRAVCDFDDRDYRIEYFRDDVREKFGEEAVYEILEEAQLSSLGNQACETLYGGELECVVRYFEHTVVVTIPADETAGIIVSFDRDAEVAGHHVLAAVEAVIDSPPCPD